MNIQIKSGSDWDILQWIKVDISSSCFHHDVVRWEKIPPGHQSYILHFRACPFLLCCLAWGQKRICIWGAKHSLLGQWKSLILWPLLPLLPLSGRDELLQLQVKYCNRGSPSLLYVTHICTYHTLLTSLPLLPEQRAIRKELKTCFHDQHSKYLVVQREMQVWLSFDNLILNWGGCLDFKIISVSLCCPFSSLENLPNCLPSAA